MELYALRRYFGIGALEAEHGIPDWERRMLLRCLNREMDAGNEGSAGPMADPFSRVPDELTVLH